MIIDGTSYPETVMTQLIGEQTLTIDNLRWQIRQKDARIAELSSELAELKTRIGDLVEKIDG